MKLNLEGFDGLASCLTVAVALLCGASALFGNPSLGMAVGLALAVGAGIYTSWKHADEKAELARLEMTAPATWSTGGILTAAGGLVIFAIASALFVRAQLIEHVAAADEVTARAEAAATAEDAADAADPSATGGPGDAGGPATDDDDCAGAGEPTPHAASPPSPDGPAPTDDDSAEALSAIPLPPDGG